MSDDKPNPRAIALSLLDRVFERGRTLADMLEADPHLAQLSARDHAFSRLLVLTVLRRLGQLDALIDERLDDPKLGGAKAGRMARNILRLGAAQLIFLKTPPHAAVDTSVALASRRNTQRFKDLVNAVLRRIADTGSEEAKTQDAARLNTPDWLWNRWCAEYGTDKTREIATAHLCEPPLDISADITQMTSRFAEIIPPHHRRGNCIPFAAIRWPDFGDQPSVGRPFGQICRHSDTPPCRFHLAVDFPGLRRGGSWS